MLITVSRLVRRALAATGYRAATLVVAVALTSVAGGCGSDSVPLRNVAYNGYVIWYPADASVEPGQVYLYDSAVRGKFADRPAAVPTATGGAVAGQDAVRMPTDVTELLGSLFTKHQISKAGPFSGELHAGTVIDGTVEYGPATVVSVAPADVAAASDAGYARAVQLVRENRPGLLYVASVVTVPEVTFTLTCRDPNQLVTRLPRLRALTRADLDVRVTGDNQAKLTLRAPAGGPGLVVGVLPVRGADVDAPIEQSRQRLAAAGLFATSQQFAIPSGASAVTPTGAAVVVAGDTAEDVDRKYAAAVAGPVQPRLTTRPTTGPASMPSTAPAVFPPPTTGPRTDPVPDPVAPPPVVPPVVPTQPSETPVVPPPPPLVVPPSPPTTVPTPAESSVPPPPVVPPVPPETPPAPPTPPEPKPPIPPVEPPTEKPATPPAVVPDSPAPKPAEPKPTEPPAEQPAAEKPAPEKPAPEKPATPPAAPEPTPAAPAAKPEPSTPAPADAPKVEPAKPEVVPEESK